MLLNDLTGYSEVGICIPVVRVESNSPTKVSISQLTFEGYFAVAPVIL